jgi:pimeloyl-ACP methyl ester carboxylesterase
MINKCPPRPQNKERKCFVHSSWLFDYVRPVSAALALLLLGLPFVLWGCATHPEPHYAALNSNVLRKDDHFRLAVVEFGEFGSYADPKLHQINTAIDLIRNIQRPLLVIYIHGWHNHVTSPDVDRFGSLLSRLAQSKQVKDNHFTVVGMYFAWPGDSLSIPVVNTLTFWDRKRTAERIASNGDCLDAIEQLSQATRLHSPSYVFLIGHSFGGLIVERTVAHTMRTLQGQTVAKPPWDLALILNPASDSVLARQLVEDLHSLYSYDAGRYLPRAGGQSRPEDQPTIVELQSENDTATGGTFPIGTSLGNFVGGHWAWDPVPVPKEDDKTNREIISERQFALKTPGNNPLLISYVIEERPKIPKPQTKADAFEYNLENNPQNRIFFTSARQDAESTTPGISKFGVAPRSIVTKWRAWQICYAGDAEPAKYARNVRVPFWIVRVPKDIIDNHGGIWSDNDMALMAAIFRLHNPRRQETIVSGHAIHTVTVPAPAKPLVLPENPALKGPTSQ